MSTPQDFADTKAALINVPAVRAPTMVLVSPGDPLASFLLAKVEYSDVAACGAVTCGHDGCGSQAPIGGALPEDQLTILRSWIMLGAE